MIYRGFITANSPRTAATNAGEKLVGRKRKEKRERERELRATPPTSHLLRVSSHDVGTWGPFWAGPQTPRTTTTRSVFGNLFPPFCSLECVNPEARLAFGARYICRRFNFGITSQESFRSNENMESSDRNNFTLRIILLLLTVIKNSINYESFLILGLNVQFIWREFY